MAKKLFSISYYEKLLHLDLSYFIKGGSWLTLGFLLTSIAGLLSSYFFAHLWTKELFGQYSFFLSLVIFLSSVTLPGINQTLMQATAERKEGVLTNSIQIMLKASLVGSLILLLSALYFYLKGQTILSIALLLSSFIFPIFATYNLFTPFLTGKGDFKKLTFFNIISQTIPLLLVILTLLIFPNLLAVSLVSIGSISLINFLLVKNLTTHLSNTKTDQHLITLGKNISNSQILTIGADYLDKLLVPLFLGFQQNAIYAFAILIPNQLNSLFKIFPTLAINKVAYIHNKNLRKSLIRNCFLLEIIIFLVIMAYILAAPTIFKLFFVQYQTSVFLSQLLALSLLYFPTTLLWNALVKLRAGKEIGKFNRVYSFFSVITLLILLPTLGLLGVVIYRISTRIVQTIGFTYFFWQSTNEKI